MRRHLGALVARWHIIDPPSWCGAVMTTLYGVRGDPLPSWTISLVEIGIKVIVVESAEET